VLESPDHIREGKWRTLWMRSVPLRMFAAFVAKMGHG
jgi:hypothetical protein